MAALCERHGLQPGTVCHVCARIRQEQEQTVRPAHEELIAICVSEWATMEMVRVEGSWLVVRGFPHQGGGRVRLGAGEARVMVEQWALLTGDLLPKFDFEQGCL